MENMNTRSKSQSTPKASKGARSTPDQTSEELKALTAMVKELKAQQNFQLAEVSQKLDHLCSSVEELRKETAEIKLDISKLKQKDTEIENKIDKLENSVPELIQEAIIKDKKRLNLMLFGIPSGKWDQLDECFQGILGELNIKLKGSAKCELTTRNEKAPVRVILENFQDKDTVLKAATKLRRSAKYQHVYITPDLTFKERARQRECVKELRERSAKDPEKKYGIKNFRVVEKNM